MRLSTVPQVGLLLAAGCGYGAPGAANPSPGTEVPTSFGVAWNAVIDHFTTNTIPIRTLDRASGVIITELMTLRDKDAEVWADCGGNVLGDVLAATGSYNVVVRGDSAKAMVRVTARWLTTAGKECPTKGVYERELEAGILARAKLASAPRP
jgi:hypothetical protein